MICFEFPVHWFKVANTSGQIFEKKYDAVPQIFFTDKLLSYWSKA